MRTVGVIVEYNPFHNGHRYHLRQSRSQSDAEVVVAVMSGHFLQRGEPALIDKWVRTRMALSQGVDLVLELPFVFACNSAPHFARASVQTLCALGGVQTLCFGSEAGELERLQSTAKLMWVHRETIERETRRLLRKGVGFPAARQQVLEQQGLNDAAAILGQPNNILGLEYLQALQTEAPDIEPLTVKRVGAGYHETRAAGDIASATGIRQRLVQGEPVCPFLPDICAQLLDNAAAAGQTIDPVRLETAQLMALQQDAATLGAGYQVDDGLGKRLMACGTTAQSLPQLIAQVKSRQWTQTRIQRVLIYRMMGVNAAQMLPLVEQGPAYLRLLGHSEKGQKFLAASRKKRTLPLLGNLSRAYSQLKRYYGRNSPAFLGAEQMLALDLRATRIYRLLQKHRSNEPLNQDFYQPVIRGGD